MNKSKQLMAARLGMFRSGETNVGNMSTRLTQMGGFPQQNRMILGKFRSLKRALDASYQGAFITPVDADEIEQPEDAIKALINPNKLKQDYDDKILSVSYEYGLEPGTVFKWINTNSYWIIYLQDLDELAYFRGDIRRCRYTIKWKDDEQQEHSVYVALTGPEETRIDNIQKQNISVDVPNHSINFLVTRNEDTLAFFTRYRELYLQEDQSICWRIETLDSLSMPGIIQVTAVEYYRNPQADEDGIVDDQLLVPLGNEDESGIRGDVSIKPKKEYMYITDQEISEWKIKEEKMPIKLTVIDSETVVIKWLANYGGEFTLVADSLEKRITVESLF